jgi:Tfp pilus assembly protein PilF
LEALALDQNDAKIHSNYASLLTRFGRMYEAETEYNKTLSMDHESAEGNSSYGNLLLEMGLLSEAEKKTDELLT